MSEMCWEINQNCMAKKEGAEKQPCPAYEQKISCWELDWQPLIQKASQEQREMMGKWMQENCPKCPAYVGHEEQISSKIGLIT